MRKKKRQKKAMCKIVIRRMQMEDLPEVCVIEKDNFSLPWSAESFAESLDFSGDIL